MTKKTFYYISTIEYHRPGDHTSSASQPTEIITAARKVLVDSYEFYRGLDGVQITCAQIESICGTCNGTGQISRGVRVIKWVRCPACKGQDPKVTTELWVNLPRELWL